MRTVLLIVCLLILVFPPAAGYNVSSVHVEPSGGLIPGTPVTAAFKIGWNAGSGEPFPSEQILDMTTELANPKWTYTPLCSGPDKIIPGTPRLVDFGSYEICPVYDSLRVTLEGITPAVNETANRTIIGVHERPDSCAPRTCFSYEYGAVVISLTGTSQKIADATEELRAFRSHIEENTSRRIDTSSAEAKYLEAERKITSARTRPAIEYAGALDDLNAARTAIDEGESVLDKAWAETEIANARIPVEDTDAVIRWFKGNSSTAAEPGLDQIVAKRHIAANYLIAANDELGRGNFSGARADAREAYRTGNESYHDALGLQTATVCGPGCGFPITFIAAGIGALVVAIGTYFLWKKRK
jgi:hypothetical protein